MVRCLIVLLACVAALATAWGPSPGGSPIARADATDLAHVIVHAHEDAHHHHDDGGLHLQEGGESGFHVHIDGPQVAALAGGLPNRLTCSVGQGPPCLRPQTLPSPAIDGLLRPPRSVA